MAVFKIIYQSGIPARVDKFLAIRVPDLARGEIQDRIREGLLKIDGTVVRKISRKIARGQKIEFDYQTKDAPPSIELLIRYEDRDTLIIDKPADVVVIPTRRKKSISVLAAVLKKYPEIGKVGDPERPGIVHRLDKQTSGLLIVAKTQAGFEHYKNLFRERELNKEYLALVYGQVRKHGVVEQPLAKIGYKGQSRVSVDESGREAVTEYWAEKYFRSETEKVDTFTLIRVKLHTGRTHQIRVHMASIGHPVMGDTLYGKQRSQKLKDILPRQFLHASRLEFKKPDGTWLEIESKLPEDLKKVLNSLTS